MPEYRRLATREAEDEFIKRRKDSARHLKEATERFLQGKRMPFNTDKVSPENAEWVGPKLPDDPKEWTEEHKQAFTEFVIYLQRKHIQEAQKSFDVLYPPDPLEDDYVVYPDLFADFTMNGYPIDTLVNGVIEFYGNMERTPYAVRGLKAVLVKTVQTSLKDAYTLALGAAMIGRERDDMWWVRVISGDTCARCIILAGKKAKRPTMGFERHEGCDCSMIPVPGGLASAHDPRTDPMAHFRQMTREQQDKRFGKEKAEMLRTDPEANIIKLVNMGRQKSPLTRPRRMVAVLSSRKARARAEQMIYQVAMTSAGRTPMLRLTPHYLMAEDKYGMRRVREDLIANGYLVKRGVKPVDLPIQDARYREIREDFEQRLKLGYTVDLEELRKHILDGDIIKGRKNTRISGRHAARYYPEAVDLERDPKVKLRAQSKSYFGAEVTDEMVESWLGSQLEKFVGDRRNLVTKTQYGYNVTGKVQFDEKSTSYLATVAFGVESEQEDKLSIVTLYPVNGPELQAILLGMKRKFRSREW